MDTQRQAHNVAEKGNNTRRDDRTQGQTGPEQINTDRENISNEGDGPAQAGNIPSEIEIQKALKRDNLHDDSSLEPDTPGPEDRNDHQLDNEDVPG